MCIAEERNRVLLGETRPEETVWKLATFQGKTNRTRSQKNNRIEPNESDDNHGTHLPSVIWRQVVLWMLLGAFTLSTSTTAQSLPWGSKNHHNLLSMWTIQTDTSVEKARSSHDLVEEVLPAPTNQAICVPGGGFSGFWFTMGQLQSMKMPSLSHDYYCYSAGCLCVVAYLADLSVHQMLDAALEASGLWREGKITRFEVVPYFVDKMIQMIMARQQEVEGSSGSHAGDPHSNSTTIVGQGNRPNWLQNLRIVTGTRKENGWGIDTSVRAPVGSISEEWTFVLRKMLLQTAWIPVMTGDTLFLDDHIDGGFVSSRVWHKCNHAVEAVWNWELLSTCFDTNLSREQALYFWEAGLAHTPSIRLP